jgi:hypothetical protein
MPRLLLILFLTLFFPDQSVAFVIYSHKSASSPVSFLAKKKDNVESGSKDYVEGLFSSSIRDEPVERVTGDAILGPTFKVVGVFSILLIALFLGFMAANGLL